RSSAVNASRLGSWIPRNSFGPCRDHLPSARFDDDSSSDSFDVARDLVTTRSHWDISAWVPRRIVRDGFYSENDLVIRERRREFRFPGNPATRPCPPPVASPSKM